LTPEVLLGSIGVDPLMVYGGRHDQEMIFGLARIV